MAASAQLIEEYLAGPQALRKSVAGMSREQIAQSFLGSREAGQELVGRYYADFLGRDGDAAGVARWLAELQTGHRSAAGVAQAFLASQEFFDRAVR